MEIPNLLFLLFIFIPFNLSTQDQNIRDFGIAIEGT